MSEKEESRATRICRILLNIVCPLAVIVAICILGPRLLRFFAPFVIGWIIAMIANPLVRFLEKKLKIVRKHSSVVIVVTVLAAIIGLLYLIISRVVMQAMDFARDMPGIYAYLVSEVKVITERFAHVFTRLPADVQNSWNELSSNISAYLSLAVQKMATPTVTVAGNVAKGIPAALVYTIITIMSAYFFIAERDKILNYWRRYMPQSVMRYYHYLRTDVKRLIGGYFVAQFRIMFIVAVVLAVGLTILGVKFSLLLSVLIAILDFLPVFGTGTVLFPWALLRALSGEYAFAAGLVLIYILTQVIRQVIQPKIVGDAMGLPPLWTLLFLYLGFKWHGIAGMILAVPVGILVLNLYHFGAFDSLIENVILLVKEVQEFRKH